MRDQRLGDDRLREAWARAMEARQVPDRAGCVDPDALLAAVRREGPEAARLATLDHATACPACRRELELLRAIERAGGERARPVATSQRWRGPTLVALAAAAGLAISLGPGPRPWRDDEPVMRGETGVITLLAPEPSATVTAPTPLTFAWRAVPDARRYAVELFATDGAMVLGGETADTSLTLATPDSLRAGDYQWLVSAQTADGATVRSTPRPLRLERR